MLGLLRPLKISLLHFAEVGSAIIALFQFNHGANLWALLGQPTKKLHLDSVLPIDEIAA
jgi:hypothetical protein